MDTETNDRWIWNEPSSEEFNRRRKEETFYRIYHVLENGDSFVDYKFWAKNGNEAHRVLISWRMSGKAVPGVEYFYSTSGYYMDSNGTRYDDMSDMMANERSRMGKLRTAFKSIEIFLYRAFGKVGETWRGFKDAIRRAFTGHSIIESWDLMDHVLSDLEYNLPIMIKYTNSHPDTLTYDQWTGVLSDLLLHVKLYRFYTNYGIAGDSEEDRKFEAEWAKTIPTIPGTNGELDYKRLHEMTSSEWNSIIDTLREWGPSLWD